MYVTLRTASFLGSTADREHCSSKFTGILNKMVPRICILVVCLVLVAEHTDAKKPRKSIDEDDIKDLISKKVDPLKERLDQIATGETCSAGNVHFYFHGDQDGHDHAQDDKYENDQHVHVHVHADDHSSHQHDHQGERHEHIAVCDTHDPSQHINGHLVFFQMSDEAHAGVAYHFKELGDKAGTAEYPVHVHTSGDLRSGCDDLGPHFDPYDEDVDVGDLGVISVDDGKKIDDSAKSTHLTLFGDTSIVGRSVVIHSPSSHSTKLACCVIGWSSTDYTGDFAHGHLHDIDHDSHDHSHESHGHASHDHSGHNH